MSICWYCYWGWSKEVMAIYGKYISIAGESAMHFGAAHIVWEDENFERYRVQFCLDNYEKYKRDDCSDIKNEAVKQSLIELLALSDDILNPKPSNYDGENPENFPPKVDMVR